MDASSFQTLPQCFFREVFQIVCNHDDQSLVVKNHSFSELHYTGTVGGTYRAGCGHLLTPCVYIYN